MARRVDGPEITGQVTHKQTGQVYGGVTVTVSPKVYTDPEMTASVTSLTADGTGVFSCYAPPGVYTFTTTAVDSAPIESVEVLGREGGTGVSTAASVPSPTLADALKVVTVKADGTGYELDPTAALSNATPQPLGSAVPGTSAAVSRDDHVHAAPATSATAANSPFGSGSDGAVNFDGVTAAGALWDKSGNTYTLKQDLLATNITVAVGITLSSGASAINANGTLTNNGTITATFNNASGATAGALAPDNGAGGVSSCQIGRAGGNGATGAGGAASNNGQNTANAGGGGGNGGAGGTGAAGSGLAQSTNNVVRALLRRAPFAFSGFVATANGGNGTASFTGPVLPGNGGGGGGGDGTNAGGGGGSGGSTLIVNAKILVNNGSITAPGGNGANGVAGNAGGGGGGGGGVVVVNTTASSGSGTITAPGGTNGAGVGTGAAGIAGTAGVAILNVWT